MLPYQCILSVLFIIRSLKITYVYKIYINYPISINVNESRLINSCVISESARKTVYSNNYLSIFFINNYINKRDSLYLDLTLTC